MFLFKAMFAVISILLSIVLSFGFSEELLTKKQKCLSYLHDRNEIIYYNNLIKNSVCHYYDQLQQKNEYQKQIDYHCLQKILNRFELFEKMSYGLSIQLSDDNTNEYSGYVYFNDRQELTDCYRAFRHFTDEEKGKTKLSISDKNLVINQLAINSLPLSFYFFPNQTGLKELDQGDHAKERSNIVQIILGVCIEELKNNKKYEY